MPTRQAIQTTFLGPTNHRGARIKATANAGSVTIRYPHELNSLDAHDKAALALIAKWGWWGRWARGGHPRGHGGWVYVWVGDHPKGAHIGASTAVIE